MKTSPRYQRPSDARKSRRSSEGTNTRVFIFLAFSNILCPGGSEQDPPLHRKARGGGDGRPWGKCRGHQSVEWKRQGADCWRLGGAILDFLYRDTDTVVEDSLHPDIVLEAKCSRWLVVMMMIMIIIYLSIYLGCHSIRVPQHSLNNETPKRDKLKHEDKIVLLRPTASIFHNNNDDDSSLLVTLSPTHQC